MKTTTTPAAKAAAVKQRLTIPSGTVLKVLLIDGLALTQIQPAIVFWRAWQNPSSSMGARFFRKGRRFGAVL